MKKFLITAFTLLISLGVMAQATNDRTLRLYYGGEVIFSRLVSQLDSLNFKVNTVEDEEEDKPVVPDISTCDKNYSESGLYLGVIGFNNKLTEKELGLLTPSTVNSYKTFVNNLSVGNATVLYYAEENGLDRLTQSSFPSDLISASIVTFTDGLDQGSVAYNEYYENMGIAQYLTDLNGRILSEKVCGSNIKIDAYAIGLQGKDVQDVDAFKNNLKKLSSSEDKMFEANDMDEVNETFNNIARSLYSATSIFSMTFNIPMPSNGEVIRFTFDNVEKAEDSKCYIEGTYRSRNLEDLKFEGCLYQGPAVISGVKSGVEMSFSFEGLSDMNNEQLPRTNIQNFKKSSVNGIWQLNSEFDGNSNVEIEEEQKTAVVMLVLDCSSSLGDDFARMKSAANNFISLLLNASEQNNTVSFDANGGTGSMSSMTFGKGETKTLTANTFTRTGYTFTGWNTKADGTGISYTNKQSITPTENLTLYAQWEESLTGMANGHEWVDLGLPSGTKWATMNVGAESPEDYGDYFAWGETQPKATYTLDNYKWYDSETETYTKYPFLTRSMAVEDVENVAIIQKRSTGSGVYLRGNGDWDTLDREFTDKGNGVYEYEQPIILTSEFKIASEDWSTVNYGSYGEDAKIGTIFVKEGSQFNLAVPNVIHATKLILDINASTLTIEGTVGGAITYSSWTICGVGELLGEPWDPTSTSNLMTESNGVYTLVKYGVELMPIFLTDDILGYGYKVVANGKWGIKEYPAFGNQLLIVDVAGVYDVTFTWYPEDEYLEATATYVKDIERVMSLELDDDAVNANWGGDWRMPSDEEVAELIDNCTWIWTTQNGVNGYKVISEINGNSIFLPAAGSNTDEGLYSAGLEGYYWTSSLVKTTIVDTYPCCAYNLFFFEKNIVAMDASRNYGRPVRPVLR